MDWLEPLSVFAGPYLVLVLGALLAGGLVQLATKKLQQAFVGPGSIPASSGLTGGAVAQRLLAVIGLQNVRVTRGSRIDCYHPRRKEIQLRNETYDSSSLSATSVAAHEVGHAQQFAGGFWAARLHQLLWPACYVFFAAVVGLIVLGLTFLTLGDVTPWIAGGACLILVLQAPVVLPLERDASRRARELARNAGLINEAELKTFDRVLGAASRTYLAMEGYRWIILIAVAGTMLLEPSSFGAFVPEDVVVESPHPEPPQPPPLPVQPTPEELAAAQAQLDLLEPYLWLSTAVVPIVVMVVIAFSFHGWTRRQKAPTLQERAVERNNTAMKLYECGRLAEARQEYDAALLLDPSQVAAHMNRGTCYLRMGKLEESLADYEATAFLAPGFADAVAARGEVHGRLGKHEFALADFDEAIRLAPQNTTALNLRGNLWITRRDLEKALADFERALALNPRDPLALNGRAVVRLARQELDLALADCEQAIACGLDAATACTLRGQIRLHSNDYDGAIEDFNAVLKDNAAQPDVLRDRGLAWLFKGVLYRAAADLDESLRLNPTDAVAFNNRGAVFLKAGEYARAVADLQKAMELDARFANPHKHLAWLRATCPHPEFRNGADAVAHATRALELSAWKNSEWLGVLAAAHALAGDVEQAVHWQTKCVSDSPAEARAEAEARLALYQSGAAFRDRAAGLA